MVPRTKSTKFSTRGRRGSYVLCMRWTMFSNIENFQKVYPINIKCLWFLEALFWSPFENLIVSEELDEICSRLSPSTVVNPHKSVLGTGNYDINVIMGEFTNILKLKKNPHLKIWYLTSISYEISVIKTTPCRNRHWEANILNYFEFMLEVYDMLFATASAFSVSAKIMKITVGRINLR